MYKYPTRYVLEHYDTIDLGYGSTEKDQIYSTNNIGYGHGDGYGTPRGTGFGDGSYHAPDSTGKGNGCGYGFDFDENEDNYPNNHLTLTKRFYEKP